MGEKNEDRGPADRPTREVAQYFGGVLDEEPLAVLLEEEAGPSHGRRRVEAQRIGDYRVEVENGLSPWTVLGYVVTDVRRPEFRQ